MASGDDGECAQGVLGFLEPGFEDVLEQDVWRDATRPRRRPDDL
jgi:hypothetical protein